MSFKPSKYQSDIFTFVKNGAGNAVINAVAGSGKTTTLIESLKLIDKNSSKLFLAFNKSIKEEIEVKLKKNNISVDINTCHGFGYTTILNNFEHKTTIDNFKYRKLLRALNNNFQFQNASDISNWGFDTKMLKYINIFDIDWLSMTDRLEFQNRVLKIADLSRLFLVDNKKELKKICDKYTISITGDEIKLALALVKLANDKLHIIDYIDMIYLPNHLNMTCEQYDFVFIDECQDLNGAQRELMLKSLKPGGRFIAVGDKRQAIYAFAGADSDSFDKLQQIPNTITLPLSECYRCGSEIIKTVKEIVPQIEAHESTGIGIVNQASILADINQGDMILCRNTYPLVKLCLKYLSMGIKATIMGGDIGKSLIKLVKDTNELDMQNVFNKLYSDLTNTLKRVMTTNGCNEKSARNKPEYINALEKIQVIEAIFNANGGNSEDIINNLNKIFSDNKEGILLSTIHKAKGLESDRVFIIHNELLPSRFAEQPWELEQEQNLRYVAHTRAKNYLGFIRDFDAFSNTDNETFANRVKMVKKSQHVGKIGDKIPLIGKITTINHMERFNSNVYTIEDEHGNIYEKWGKIENRFIKDGILKIGAEIKAKARVSKHTSYNGLDKTTVKNFSH